MTYADKLKDPRWQKKRLKVFERDNWKCRFCGNTDRNLQIHHTRYFPEFEPWDYESQYLITLCNKCHQSESDNRKEADKELSSALCQIGFSHYDIALITQLIKEDKGNVINYFRYEVFLRYELKHAQK